MWERLGDVDWEKLNHSHGRAYNVPRILRSMISADAEERDHGWSCYIRWLHPQGQFFDASAAAVPFLIEALDEPDVPIRVKLLDHFCDRLLIAPDSGGDPWIETPPAIIAASNIEAADDDELNDDDVYLNMSLSAWQTGRAIQAGRMTYLRLLHDPDRAVAAAAAKLLMMWRETRATAKQALAGIIEAEPDAVKQSGYLLDFGVFGDAGDVPNFERWLTAPFPWETRAAAALAWAWAVHPKLLPTTPATTLEACAMSDVFGRLPWTGLYHRGPCILPANVATLILQLAENDAPEVRFHAIQGLNTTRQAAKNLSSRQVIPTLLRALVDLQSEVRAAAAQGLAERGDAVVVPGNVPALLEALVIDEPTDGDEPLKDDVGYYDALRHRYIHSQLENIATACGIVAGALADFAERLDFGERMLAAVRIENAIRYFAVEHPRIRWDSSEGTLSTGVTSVLQKCLERLREPKPRTLAELFYPFAHIYREEDAYPYDDYEGRLALRFAEDPQGLTAAAIAIVAGGEDRNVAMGAANFLATLGPAAESALSAFAFAEGSELDAYAKERIGIAGTFIRKSLAVIPAVDIDDAHRANLEASLAHPEAQVRAGAADLIA